MSVLEKREDRPLGISIFKEEGEEKKSPKKTKVKSQPGEHADMDVRVRAWAVAKEGTDNSDKRCREV